MQKFDCLAPDCPLLGPHLLEASAGTGKTFSIEHVFVRLILEGIAVEQILAVTFTRAATRELKARIRSTMETAVCKIEKRDRSTWQYLDAHLDAPQSLQRLTDALACFDECQIFTIHGFCYRMLREFAFEANVGSVSNPDEGQTIPESLRLGARDFIEHKIGPSLLCLEQVQLLLKECKSLDALAGQLLQWKEAGPSLSFAEGYDKCKAALHVWQLDEEKLLADFRALENNYKACKGKNFEKQVRALANLEHLPALLKEKGSLFDFLHAKNRKVRAETPKFLHYPGFFDWAQVHIAPLVQQNVLPILQKAFAPIAEKILAQEDHLDPDAILLRMQQSLHNSCFKEQVQKKYAAAIVDEFQDTDAVQWDILQTLFLYRNNPKIQALYLVGDPKQSIYRFRNADIYTYLAAQKMLGEQNTYLLDTNYRSSKNLVGALNALFNRTWLPLPKTGAALPYHLVQPGVQSDADFADGKGAIHFMMAAEGDFETVFLPYAVREIERLSLKRCALLVKDRYQAMHALEVLKKRGHAAVAKSHTPLGKTDAFKAIEELFGAILHPHDQNAVGIVMAGPFAKPDLYFPGLKTLLEEQGLVPFARQFALDADALQIFEQLFAWEQKEGFSFEGLKRHLQTLKTLDSAEAPVRRMDVDEEAIQIMTLHISKGLEFDVVFALGLASRTPQSADVIEGDAEKLRQLYVAMTRAKKRVYVPVSFIAREAQPGTLSPMELFARYFEGSLEQQIETLSQQASISVERIAEVHLAPAPVSKKESVAMPPPPLRPFQPSFLSSFTTLAKTKESDVPWTQPDGAEFSLQTMPRGTQTGAEFSLQTMPRGTQTGIAIHALFEAIFRAKGRDPMAVHALVEEQLRHSALEPWKGAIQQMVKQTLQMPLEGDGEWFTLSEMDLFQIEAEFVFRAAPDFVKGFIDLLFYRNGKVYFVDWKTNWLESYEPAQLQKAMQTHDYYLQADLYAEAIHRHFKAPFGGAYYIFVRGNTYVHTKHQNKNRM
ncbi:MAG: UvrD-helicase domain-containing protein [Verrucomicrobia bacterium]|nr:UvrD-helicase domain-containing protein [Verrucomicrobiota bacterium]